VSHRTRPRRAVLGRTTTDLRLSVAEVLTTARAGHGQVALISGEAGIGKTRLVQELADLALAQGWTLLDAHCFPQDRLCPYAPFLDLFRMHFWQRPDDLAAFSGELAPLLPDLLPGSTAAPPSRWIRSRRNVVASRRWRGFSRSRRSDSRSC